MTLALRKLGNDVTRTTGRANHHGVMAMENAMRVADPNSRGPTTVVPKKISREQVREEFSAVICQFSRRQLAKAAGCTTDGAKHWLEGTRSPDLANTLNCARSLPAVQAWLIERAGAGDRAAHSGSADAVLAIVRRLALGEGPDAAAARAILREAGRREEQQEQTPESAVVRDLFARRR